MLYGSLCIPAGFFCQNGFYWLTLIFLGCWFQKNKVPLAKNMLARNDLHVQGEAHCVHSRCHFQHRVSKTFCCFHSFQIIHLKFIARVLNNSHVAMPDSCCAIGCANRRKVNQRNTQGKWIQFNRIPSGRTPLERENVVFGYLPSVGKIGLTIR